MTDRNSDDSINRRTVLKHTSSLAAVGGLGAMTAAGESSSTGNKPEWNVKSVNWDTSNGTTQYIRHLMSSEYTRGLKQILENQGFHPNPSNITVGEIVTSSEEVNSYNPKHVLVPFVKRETSQDESPLRGVIDITLVDTPNTPQVVGAFGGFIDDSGADPTVHLIGNKSAQSHSSDTPSISSASQLEPVAGIVAQKKVPQSEVGIQTSFSCATCQIIYGYVCQYFGSSVTSSVCYLAGATCFGAGNIPAAIGCWGVCTIVVGGIQIYGCFYSAPKFCNYLDEANC